VGDRLSGYTDLSVPKTLFWGVMRTIGRPNPLNEWVRRKCFYLKILFWDVRGNLFSSNSYLALFWVR
jgi:hypothetical protein